ncbi:MAG: dTDP-4-dehydrorhamnose reductase, partial [Pseudomonadota bacterium]
MTILVFGKTGQVATELQRWAPVVALGRDQADLTHPQDCAQIIRDHAPTAVINAAAYTAVDQAEDDEPLATVINGAAPTAMAQACAALNIPFVHISTDYVFAGDGTAPWAPWDQIAPSNAYGRSKLQGEQGICTAGGAYAILRTSWVFSAHGVNFVKTMLRVSDSHDTLSVVADQIGGPTSARAIAQACLKVADQLTCDTAGIYHFSGAPDVSWHGFAQAIFAQAGRDITVHPISTSDYPTPATRPLNSRMNCDSTLNIFDIARPDWQADLADVLT